VEPFDTIKVSVAHAIEFQGSGAIWEHRTFTGLIDEHDDGACPPCALDYGIDARSLEASHKLTTDRVCADPSDEPDGRSGSSRSYGNVCGASAPSPAYLNISVGPMGDIGGQPCDDVLDQVTDAAQHNGRSGEYLLRLRTRHRLFPFLLDDYDHSDPQYGDNRTDQHTSGRFPSLGGHVLDHPVGSVDQGISLFEARLGSAESSLDLVNGCLCKFDRVGSSHATPSIGYC
jgi:hypothetical protein